jgi:hypothetical protein
VTLADVVRRAVIDPHKLMEYALNPQAPRGRHKALVFARVLGYTRDNYARLLQQLEAQALEAEVHLHSQDAFGRRYTADMPIEGPAGQRAIVRTGWLVPMGADEGRLITLWVKE